MGTLPLSILFELPDAPGAGLCPPEACSVMGAGRTNRSSASAAPPVQATAHPVVTGGMPGWQITQIALGAALVAAVIAVLLNRTRTARRLAHPAT
jgi:hypothetical protein